MDYILDLRYDFESSQYIRVAVLPISSRFEVTSPRYKYYYNSLSNLSTIYLNELPLDQETTNGPFHKRTYNDWMEGKISLNMEFVSSPTILEEVKKDQWSSINLYRKVLGVIGIVLCSDFAELSQAKQLFSSALKHFPEAISAKCFAFQPTDKQSDDCADSHFIIIYPDIEYHNFNQFLKLQVMEMAAIIVKELESWITSDKVGPAVSPSIPIPVGNDKGIDPLKLKKRKQARVSKLRGDACVLCGSPKDAISYYDEAIDQSKEQADWASLAISLEASIGPILYSKLDNQDITDRALESIANYNKLNATFAATECNFKLAKYYVSEGRKKEASELLMDIYEVVKDFPPPQKMNALSLIANLYKQIGFYRKYAFFLRDCANSYFKVGDYRASLSLLQIGSQHYQLEDLNEEITTISKLTRYKFGKPSEFDSNPRRPLKNKRKRDWLSVQQQVLKELIHASSSLGDPMYVARYCQYILTNLSNALTRGQQRHYFSHLCHSIQQLPYLGHHSFDIDLVGLPLLKKITVLKPTEHLIPLVKNTGTSSSIFLYDPFKDRTKKDEYDPIKWCKNELGYVKVELCNPHEFQLHISEIKLSTKDIRFESHGISVILPPLTKSHEIILTGRPLDSEGTLTILGCSVKFFGLNSEHPVNENGIGISLKEYEYLNKNPNKKQSKAPANQILIVPSLPLLTIAPEIGASKNHTIFEGEKFTANFILTNVGELPIDTINFQLNPTFSTAPERPSLFDLTPLDDPFSYDLTIFEKALPILPGKKLIFPVQVYGRFNCTGANFVFTYASSTIENYGRSSSLTFPITVQKGPQVSNVDIIPINEGPSIFHQYCISSTCLMIADVSNQNDDMSFQISWTVTGLQSTSFSLILEPQEFKRLFIPIPRFVLNTKTLPNLLEQKGQFIKSAIKYSPEEERNVRILYWYKAEILRRISLTWKCIQLNSEGTLNLFPQLFLNQKMLAYLNPDIVTFKLENSTQFVTNQFHKIQITITNVSFYTLFLKIQLQPYQDQENGIHISNLQEHLVFVGPLQFNVENVSPQQSITIEWLSCFLSPGFYKLSVSCTGTAVNIEELSTQQPPSLEVVQKVFKLQATQ